MGEEILDQYLVIDNHKNKFKNRAVLIWLLPLILGIIGRVAYFPGSSVLLIVFSAGLQAYCLNGVIDIKERNLINKALSIVGLVWFVFLFWAAFFNEGMPYNTNALKIYFAVLVIYFTAYYLLFHWLRVRNKKS